MRRYGIILLCCAAIFSPLMPMSAAKLGEAQAAENVPMVKGQLIRDFARITFEWPRSTYLSAHINGRTLIVQFDRPANPNFRALLTQLAPFVIAAKLENSGKQLVLTLDKPYRIRTFVSETINGIDILDVDAAAYIAHRHPKPSVSPEAKPVVQAPPVVPRTTQVAALAPKAGDQETPKEAPKEAHKTLPEAKPVVKTDTSQNPKPTAEIKPTPKPEVKPEVKAPAVTQTEKTAQKSEEPKEEAKKEIAASTPSDSAAPPAIEALPQAMGSATGTPEMPTLKLVAGASDGKTVLRFIWQERAAAAVFERGNYVWIVFNKPMPVDWSNLKDSAGDLYSAVRQFAHDQATIVRVEAPEGTGVTAAQEPNSYEWNITLSPQPEVPPQPFAVQVNTVPPLPPHVFINALEVAQPILVTDPDIGDKLIIVPSFKAEQGINPARTFVEFNLLPTTTGLALIRKSDNVLVAHVRNGLRVGTSAGANLSTGMPTPRPEEVQKPKEAPSATLFPYQEWALDTKETPANQLAILQYTVAVAETPEEKLEARHKLAGFYLAHGMEVEALGVLRVIERASPQYYVSHRLSALTGAANFLINRYTEAARAFQAAELADNEEIQYWLATTNELLGSTQPVFNYAAYNTKYISHYPPKFRQRLGIVATDRAIAAQDYAAALKIMDILSKDNLLEGIQDYTDFLNARIAYAAGQTDQAVEVWQQQSKNYRDNLVRAHAEFTLITEKLNMQKIEPIVAIDHLEKLRLSWRGDRLELDTLLLLGKMYDARDEYVQAMGVWRDVISQFPGSPEADDADRRLRATFAELFDKGLVATLKPLDQLALYYDYRYLTPEDDSGNRIINTLVDRLLALDLVDEAADVLERRMQYYALHEERSRQGARLARIYLLKQAPAKALTALSESVYGDNTPDINAERDRLAAQALVELNRYDEAMALLENDKSPDAEAVRLRAWWVQKDWPKVAASLENTLKERGPLPETPSASDTRKVLMLATAYRTLEESAQLQYLRDYYGPALKETPNYTLFNYLTEPNIPVTPVTFEMVMQQAENTKAFLADYRIVKPDDASKPEEKTAAP